MTSVMMSNCPAALSADQEPLTGPKYGLLPGPGPVEGGRAARGCGGGGGVRRGAALSGRWRVAALLLAAAVAALLAAALVAEVVRARAERQQLRADVDDLRRRLHDRDLLAELRAFEDAVYEEEAAMDEDEEDDVETDEDLQESLEGDDDGGSGTGEDSDESDEEYVDDDYLEYTLPAPVGAAAGETPDQRLRDKYADVLAGMASKLHEAKQAGGSKTSNLSSSSSSDEDSSNSSSSSSSGVRSRREISSASESGVPVIDESYGAPLPRAHNATSLRLYETLVGAGGPTQPPTDSPIKKHHRVSSLWSQQGQAAPKKYRSEPLQAEWRGHRGGTPPPAPLITRASRVMDTDGSRSVRIPYTPLQHRRHHHQQQEQQQQQRPADSSRPQELRQLPDSAVRKQHMAIKRKKLRALNKRKHPGTGTSAQHHLRPMPAAHFYGDSSNHTVDHDRYLGNGRLRPVNKLFTDWTPEDWFHRLGMDQHFTYEDGVVTVRRSGLYYVYAQIFYLDDKSTNGFKVLVDGEPKMQCSLHIHIAGIKSNTCFTASVMYLNENSRLSVHDIEANRYSVFDKSKSFFGLVKLGNARLP